MWDEWRVNQTVLRILKDDITILDIDAFVFYARPDLVLGSGFGGAIATRGGPKIQEELKKIGSVEPTEAAVSSGGNLKARYIIHAAGPRFQEENLEDKLRATVRSVLRRAEENKVQRLAFPAMGVGFYGVPLETCARITLGTVKEYLKNETSLKEVVFCLSDSREVRAFEEQMKDLA